MSADESAHARTAYDEALLLGLFSDSSGSTGNESLSTTASAAFDDTLAGFDADLDAFDALIASSEQGASLLLHFDAALDNEQGDADSTNGELTSSDESSNSCSATSTASVGEDAAAPVAKNKPKCAPGGNAARKRQREEIHALRETAALLERELHTLKSIAKANTPTPSNNSNTEQRHGSDTLSPDQNEPPRWTALPSQQKHSRKVPQPMDKTLLAKEKLARQLAELKNAQLSNFVSDHVTLTQKFGKALFKRRPIMSSEMATPTSIKAEMMVSELHTAGDVLVFEALAKNIDTQCLELERVFRAVGLADCRTNLMETRVDTDSGEAGGAVTLAFKSSQLMPFSVHAINELTLKNAGKRPAGNWKSVPFEEQHQTGDLTANWKSVPFKKQFQTGGLAVNVRNVARRYMENGRIVMVWEGQSEWPDKASGEVVTIREKGWSVMQPYSQSSSAKKNQDVSTPLSLFQSYIHMTAGPTKGDEGAANRKQEPRPEHIAILSDVVKPLYEKQFAAGIQGFENALLDDSLKRMPTAS